MKRSTTSIIVSVFTSAIISFCAIPCMADWVANADVTETDNDSDSGTRDYLCNDGITRSFGGWSWTNRKNISDQQNNVWSRSGGYEVTTQNRTMCKLVTWKKSYTKECGTAAADFITAGTARLGWRLDGDANDGRITYGYALTHAEATVGFHSIPGSGGDYEFTGDWNISDSDDNPISVALNISYPPGFTISYTSGGDLWSCGYTTKSKYVELDFSSGTASTVSSKISCWASAHSYYRTSAFHAYTRGHAEIIGWSFTKAP